MTFTDGAGMQHEWAFVRSGMGRFLAKTILLSFLALCFATGSGARAQSYLSPGYIFGEITNKLGFYQTPDAPDFVKKARPDPASLEYLPLKLPPRDFHSEASKPGNRLEAEASAIAELERARANTQARAAAGGTSSSKAASKPIPEPASPPPMKWNPWDTE
jgi:hypothetical protein